MGKEYEYDSAFESLWTNVDKSKRASRKELGYSVWMKTKSNYEGPDLVEQLKEKNKWVKELLKNQCDCEVCGCTG